MRALAQQATAADWSQISSMTGTIGGTVATAVGIVNGAAGLVIASVVAIATILIDSAQELRLARGQNPLTIPMANSDTASSLPDLAAASTTPTCGMVAS
mgnify:CR=1 FL=1